MNIFVNLIKLTNANTSSSQQQTASSSSSSVYIVHTEPKFVSDQNLGVVVRKMALHADIASKVYRSQGNLYGGKWYERLRQLNRIKNLSKEHYAKQQLKMPATFGNATGSSNSSSSSSSSGQNMPSNSASPASLAFGQHLQNQSDFTNYI